MMEVGERCMAERRKDRVSVNAWLFGVGSQSHPRL